MHAKERNTKPSTVTGSCRAATLEEFCVALPERELVTCASIAYARACLIHRPTGTTSNSCMRRKKQRTLAAAPVAASALQHKAFNVGERTCILISTIAPRDVHALDRDDLTFLHVAQEK